VLATRSHEPGSSRGAFVLATLLAFATYSPAHADRSVAIPLPPGNYVGHGYSTCPRCELPRWAVIVAIVSDAPRASSIARELDGRLPLGYPWLQHTDDLALEANGERGIIVVAGLFQSRTAARGFMRATPLPDGTRLVRLASREFAAHRYYANERTPEGRENLRSVVTIAHGEPVYAYAPDDVPNYGEEPEPRGFPRCVVRPLESFEVTYEELYSAHAYDWAPVRCDGELAYVRWTDTLLESTILAMPDGSHRLVQLVEVLCDQPAFREWRYDRTGRRPLEPDDVRVGPRRERCPC